MSDVKACVCGHDNYAHRSRGGDCLAMNCVCQKFDELTASELVAARARIAELEAREADLVALAIDLHRDLFIRTDPSVIEADIIRARQVIDSATHRGLGGEAVEEVRAVLEDLREAVGQLELEYEWGAVFAVDKIVEALALLPPRRP